MKLFRFASTAALCLLMAGVLAAQSASQSAQQPPAAPRTDQAAAQARDAADITIVGCLAQDKDSADAYTLTIVPAAASAAAAVAANAASDAAPATAAARPDPANAKPDAERTANASAAAAAKPATYKIVGLSADQLKPHVNHQVELKGRINAAAGQAAAAGDAPQEFRASAVKMINATCPAAK